MRANPKSAGEACFSAICRHILVSKKQMNSVRVRHPGARTNSGANAPRRCIDPRRGSQMNNFLNDLQDKINQAIENSPAKDIERNVKAMMTQGFSKLDLVTREEFDIQAQVLAKTRAKLDALELRIIALEAKLTAAEPGRQPTLEPKL
jgi:BMFP domain-containing protein YqiC